MNNVEFSNFPNDIPDNQLESKIIKICRESGVEVDHNDIEGCHRLPISRYNRDDNKRVIVKFVNRKHSESLLYKKKSISSRDFSNINIPSKIFVSVSLCPYYQFIWDKCKDLQRRGKMYQVFCLGGTVSYKLLKSFLNFFSTLTMLTIVFSDFFSKTKGIFNSKFVMS